MAIQINEAASLLFHRGLADSTRLRVELTTTASGVRILDFGVRVPGGIEAGLLLASICMAGESTVSIAPSQRDVWHGPSIAVSTDSPSVSCMAAQYAGWPVQLDKFFAMGSGPMRTKRGKEKILEELGFHDEGACAVGVLECDVIPSDEVGCMIAKECGVSPSELMLCVAPTRSLAGSIQVVARSIETCMHKLHELGFDLNGVRSAYGVAPLSPPAIDFVKGIGRTNDAILYGGEVQLWIDCEDEAIDSILEQVPSCSSRDWGTPFAVTFKKYDYDFYKVDPGLFSPAIVSYSNLRTGKTGKAGKFRPDVLSESFS